jgi:hypothetical protein
MVVFLEQLKLGFCDWERTKFTMDPDMSASVIRLLLIYTTKVDLWLPNGKLGSRSKNNFI